MGRQLDQVLHLSRCVAPVQVLHRLVVQELDGIAEVGEVLADVLCAGCDGIGAVERHQVFGIEASGNLQAVDVIQRISQAAASHGRQAGKASYRTAICIRTFLRGSHTRRTSCVSPATGMSSMSTPAIVILSLVLDGRRGRQEA
jgi:hypothetical protein